MMYQASLGRTLGVFSIAVVVVLYVILQIGGEAEDDGDNLVLPEGAAASGSPLARQIVVATLEPTPAVLEAEVGREPTPTEEAPPALEVATATLEAPATEEPTVTVEPTSTLEPTATPEPTPTPEPTAVAPPPPMAYPAGSFGYDISFPQCGAAFPDPSAFGIVGVTNGLAYTTNPCLSEQFAWASQLASPPAFYTNTSNSGPINDNWGLPGPQPCLDLEANDDLGCAYNFGWNGAAYSFAVALDVSPAAANFAWWLDVENENSWNGTTAANAAAVQGFFDYLKTRGVLVVGVYSTGVQWGDLTGGYILPGAPNWVAGAGSPEDSLAFCASGFSGGPVWLVQFAFLGFHGDYSCPNVGG